MNTRRGRLSLRYPGTSCVQDGVIYDSWNSENEIVLYYWQKESEA